MEVFTGRIGASAIVLSWLIIVMSLSLIISIALPLTACCISLSLTFNSAAAASGPVINLDPPYVLLRLTEEFRGRLALLSGGTVKRGINV